MLDCKNCIYYSKEEITKCKLNTCDYTTFRQFKDEYGLWEGMLPNPALWGKDED